MRENLISVIIPVYNTAEYLPRCLDSILNNTYRNLEVLCINDGSRDNSLEVLKGYAAKDSRVKVIDQENAGVSAARNHGLDEATGEYIAFVDSDDWVHRQYFEVLLKTMHDHNADISICDTPEVFERVADCQIDMGNLPNQLLADDLYFRKSLAVWGRIYCRRAIGAHRFQKDVRLAEDTLFNLKIFADTQYALRLSYCSYPMYFYFMRSDSAVHVLPTAEYEPLLTWHISNLDRTPSRAVRKYFLTFASKLLFAWRYEASVQEKPEEVKRAQGLIRCCSRELWKTPFRELWEKYIFLAFAQFPSLYRLFRLIQDPTMHGWEKLQREQINKKA